MLLCNHMILPKAKTALAPKGMVASFPCARVIVSKHLVATAVWHVREQCGKE